MFSYRIHKLKDDAELRDHEDTACDSNALDLAPRNRPCNALEVGHLVQCRLCCL